MKNIFLLLVLFLILTPQVGAISWCADQDTFFWNASSDISGYRILNNQPEIETQKSITTPLFSVGSGEIILGTWATPVGSPGVSMISPGLWRFRTYAYSSSTSGTTSLKFYAINRSSSGIETNLFYGNAITQDIDATGTPSEYLTSYARRNYTTMFPGDRLVIRVNASTTSSSARTLTYEIAGNTNASMVSISYFNCPSAGGSGAIAGAEGDIILYGMIGGGIGGAALMLLYRRRQP